VRGPSALVLVTVLLAGALAACGDAAADEGGVLPALCDAIAEDDPATATEVFEARVHAPLHELADEVAAVDRGVASRLLEAKYGVENVTRDETDAPAPLVHQRLQDLAEQVRVALAAMDRPTPPC
jgi:hypothetical protein